MFNNSFSVERDNECQILCRILIAFRQKNNSLSYINIRVLPKGVFIDLRARNFVHAITYLRARTLVTVGAICRALMAI